MKPTLLTRFFTWLPLLMMLHSAQAWAESQPQLLDRVVAVVNDDIILKSQLDREAELARQELQTRNINVSNMDELNMKVLDRMILEKLQLQQIKRMGLKVPDEELLGQIQQIAEQKQPFSAAIT